MLKEKCTWQGFCLCIRSPLRLLLSLLQKVRTPAIWFCKMKNLQQLHVLDCATTHWQQISLFHRTSPSLFSTKKMTVPLTILCSWYLLLINPYRPINIMPSRMKASIKGMYGLKNYVINYWSSLPFCYIFIISSFLFSFSWKEYWDFKTNTEKTLNFYVFFQPFIGRLIQVQKRKIGRQAVSASAMSEITKQESWILLTKINSLSFHTPQNGEILYLASNLSQLMVILQRSWEMEGGDYGTRYQNISLLE